MSSDIARRVAFELERVTPNQTVWWSGDSAPIPERWLLPSMRSEAAFKGNFPARGSAPRPHDAVHPEHDRA
jgi:hypothetical protein